MWPSYFIVRLPKPFQKMREFFFARDLNSTESIYVLFWTMLTEQCDFSIYMAETKNDTKHSPNLYHATWSLIIVTKMLLCGINASCLASQNCYHLRLLTQLSAPSDILIAIVRFFTTASREHFLHMWCIHYRLHWAQWLGNDLSFRS